MKKAYMPLAIASVFVAGLSVASAAIDGKIMPGMTDNFDNGSAMGWTNGARVKTPHPPHVENGKLVVESFGERFDDEGRPINDNKRMAFFNESYSFDRGRNTFDSPWEGDYSGIKAIKADFSATSTTTDNLYLRLSFTDGDKFFSSKNPFVLPTDGVERTATFLLDAASFSASGDYNKGNTFADVDQATFDAAIKNLFGVKIISNEEYPIYGGGDVVAAKLTMDNFMATDQLATTPPPPPTTVPLPGASWLMISGLVGLGGVASGKRRQQN